LNNFCGGSCAFSTGLAIPGWNTTGSQTGQWITGGFDGNPPAIDGSVLAYSNGGGAISQEVGSAIAGDTYTLQVDVLARTDASLDAVVRLEINGLVVATAAPTVPQVAGNWANWTAVYTATSAQAGEPVAILLTATGDQGDWDNVRLNGSVGYVPEPGTCVLLGIGLLGLLTLSLRRKQECSPDLYL
jgi:hypothetical protein